MPTSSITFNGVSNNDGISAGDTNLNVSGGVTMNGSASGTGIVSVYVTTTPGATSGGTLIAQSTALANNSTTWSAQMNQTVLNSFKGQTLYFYATAPIQGGTGTALYDFNGGGQDPVLDSYCFYRGTLIATPGGAVAVEALQPGDLVLTADGRAVAARWIGRQTVSTRFADPLRVLPIRIRAGALGENLPARDLLVSPAHALLLEGVLVQAGALVNGTTITREAAVPEVFTYYHVETAAHDLILAEGAAAETFVDNVDRVAFDNWAEYVALVGEAAPVAELELPRAKAQRQLPSALRARLAARAEVLLGAIAAAA